MLLTLYALLMGLEPGPLKLRISCCRQNCTYLCVKRRGMDVGLVESGKINNFNFLQDTLSRA